MIVGRKSKGVPGMLKYKPMIHLSDKKCRCLPAGRQACERGVPPLVKIELWTHAIGGLSENDFILAAKVDKIQSQSL